MSLDALSMYWADNPDHARRPGRKLPNTYTIAYAPLGNGAVQSPASIQTAGDFVCTQILGSSTTAATNVAYITLPLLLQIVISSVNVNFNSTMTEWGTSGIGINPQAGTNQPSLPYPIFIPNQSTISTLMTNPGAAANVWITFIGIQLPPK